MINANDFRGATDSDTLENRRVLAGGHEGLRRGVRVQRVVDRARDRVPDLERIPGEIVVRHAGGQAFHRVLPVFWHLVEGQVLQRGAQIVQLLHGGGAFFAAQVPAVQRIHEFLDARALFRQLLRGERLQIGRLYTIYYLIKNK